MIFFKHVLFRAAVSYQAGSLLMSSRLGRARLCSADCGGADAQGMLKVLSVLLTVNSRDEPYLAYLLMKASSKHCCLAQSVIHAAKK